MITVVISSILLVIAVLFLLTSTLRINAVKYTEEGTVTLTIRGAGREGESIQLFVSVRDTGIGIREEDMDKLFKSF